MKINDELVRCFRTHDGGNLYYRFRMKTCSKE